MNTSASNMIEPTDMLAYMSEIFEHGDTVLIHVNDLKGRQFDHTELLQNILKPDTATSCVDLQKDGHNIYLTMNPVDPVAKNRQKQNIAAIRTVYIDVDENGSESIELVRQSVAFGEIPPPHFIVSSSPNKFYVIWRVEGFTVELQEGLNRALQQKFGGDKQAIDASRVLRLPGTKNLKYEGQPVCTIVEQNPGPRLKPSDFEIEFSAIPQQVRVVVADEALESKMSEVRGFLDWAGTQYTEKNASDGGIIALFVCPFEHKSGHHEGEAFAGVGTLDSTVNFRFDCKHDSCEGIGWKEFRKRVEAMKGSAYSFGGNDVLMSTEAIEAAAKTTAIEMMEAPSSDDLPLIYQEADAPEVEQDLGDADDLPDDKWFFGRGPVKFPNAALFGITGDIIRKLSPHTESHPAGNLLDLIISLGSIIGHDPYIVVEGTKHYCNEFGVRVGKTALARKGTGGDIIRAITSKVDAVWATNRVLGGFGSGESVVHEVRDDRIYHKRGVELVAPGVSDKRLHVAEGEFANVLVTMNKQDSKMSIMFRDGWDSKALKNITKGEGKEVCQEPHLSCMADITGADILSLVQDKDKRNGSINRFLWCHVERTKKLPFSEAYSIDWSSEILQLIRLVGQARSISRVFLTESARRLFVAHYDELTEDVPGIVGAVISRGAPHCLRLALIFALLDMDAYEVKTSGFTCHIDRCHLKAALALWNYCADSARIIFGGVTAEQQKILSFIEKAPATAGEVRRELYQDNRRSSAVREDLDRLLKIGKLVLQDDKNYKKA
jgi:hypothetical protein